MNRAGVAALGCSLGSFRFLVKDEEPPLPPACQKRSSEDRLMVGLRLRGETNQANKYFHRWMLQRR